MNRKLIIFAPLLLLAACETNQQDKEKIKAQAKEDAGIAEKNAERHITRVANNVRDQVKKTSIKLREWWLTPLPDPQPTPVAASYCYHVTQDIVCYRQPLEGQTHRLIGYQGTGALPPPLAQTEPLPTIQRTKETQTTQLNAPAATPGAKRVAKAKPIFVGIPTEPKAEGAQTIDALDSNNEPLPNPGLSPQL